MPTFPLIFPSAFLFKFLCTKLSVNLTTKTFVEFLPTFRFRISWEVWLTTSSYQPNVLVKNENKLLTKVLTKEIYL